jgi:hypothetical protein
MSGTFDPWAAAGAVPPTPQGQPPQAVVAPPQAAPQQAPFDPWVAAGAVAPQPAQPAPVAPQAPDQGATVGPSGSMLGDLDNFTRTAGRRFIAATASAPDTMASLADALFGKVGIKSGLEPAVESLTMPAALANAIGDGKAAGQPIVPTYSRAMKGFADTTGVPNYQPNTEMGRILMGGASALPTAALDPWALPAAFGAGAGGQAAADALPQHPLAAALIGAALGGGTAQKAASFASAPTRIAGEVNPQLAQTLADARANGINIPAPQVSPNQFTRTAFNQSSHLPFSGSEGARDANQVAFNRALAGTMGEDAERITPAVMAQAKQRIGGVFDGVASRTTIPVDNQLMSDLQAVVDNARQTAGADSMPAIERAAMNVLDTGANNAGYIGGDQFISLTSKNGLIGRMQGASNADIKQAGGALREVLNDALARNATPDDVAALGQARSQWKAMRTIEDLAEKAGATGNISGPSLMTPARMSYGDMAYSGGGQMGALARIGQLMKEPPSSETANRALVNHLVTGIGGAALAGAGGGAGEMLAGHLGAALAGAGGFAANRLANAAMRSPAFTQRIINTGLKGPRPVPDWSTALLAQQLMRQTPLLSATQPSSPTP